MTVKILIADDETDLELLVRQRFRKQIRDKTYEFVFAHNGAEAMEMLEKDKEIDIVLSDINMPVMDGLTLLNKIVEFNPLIQAVIVSAYGDMVNIRTAMNRGAFDFLTKPIDFQDFEVTITKTLQQSTSLKQGEVSRTKLSAIQRELTIATNIQQSILPRVFPPFPQRKEIDLYATMFPARNVGGDLYDFFFIDEDRLGLVIGDVSGKGVPAAIFMAMSRTLLKATALHGADPGKCLTEVNTSLCRDNTSELFVTLFYGILNVRTGEFHYSSGGHNPPYVVSPTGALTMLEGTGDTIVGVMDDLTYKSKQADLPADHVLLLYTDGITEAMNLERDLFTEERLETLLRQSGGQSAQKLVENVVSAVRTYAGAAPQSDDLTALAVRWTK